MVGFHDNGKYLASQSLKHETKKQCIALQTVRTQSVTDFKS